MPQSFIPTFPAGRGRTFQDIPREQLQLRPDETTPILHDTSGFPVARLIPVPKNQIVRPPGDAIPDPVYQQHFSLLHPRGEGGAVQFPDSPTVYLTQDPNLPEGEAISQLTQTLRQHKLLQEARQEWPMTQDILEFLGPVGGAVVGGMTGFALGGGPFSPTTSVPAAIAGATVGGAGGAALPHATRSTLTPSRVTTEALAAGTVEHNLPHEMLMGGVLGGTGESLNQFMTLARLGVTTLGRHGFIRDIDLSPEQAALFAPRVTLPSGLTTPGMRTMTLPGGPFAQAAAITDETVFPRLETYARGPIESIAERVFNALLSKGISKRHIAQLEQNLSALFTEQVTKLRATGQNAPVGTRIMQWLGRFDKDGNFTPGSLEQGARQVMHGLYGVVDNALESMPNPPRLQTDPLSALLGLTGPNQGTRTAVQESVNSAVLRHLSDLGQESVRTLEQTSERLASPGFSTTTTQGTRTTLTPAQQRTLGQTGERNVETQRLGPQLTQTTTEQTGSSTGATTQLPLGGWLHTLDVTQGQHVPEITLGRGLQIQRAISAARMEERTLGARADAEKLTLLNELGRSIDQQLTPALNQIDPTLGAALQRARTFTASMYYNLRNEAIVDDVLNTIGRNPEEFETLARSPHLTTTIQTMREAFEMVGHVPSPLPPGVSTPTALTNGPRIFNDVIMPEIRFQAIRAALPPEQHDLARRIASGSQPVQSLIDQRRLLHVAPGTFHALREKLGQETFDLVMGGQDAGRFFITVDQALIESSRALDKGKDVGLMIAQFGGISSMVTGAGLVAQGQTAAGLAGLAAGGMLLLTPRMINRALTSPETFERIILGIRTGTGNSTVQRLLADTAAYAARDLYRPSANAPSQGR